MIISHIYNFFLGNKYVSKKNIEKNNAKKNNNIQHIILLKKLFSFFVGDVPLLLLMMDPIYRIIRQKKKKNSWKIID